MNHRHMTMATTTAFQSPVPIASFSSPSSPFTSPVSHSISPRHVLVLSHRKLRLRHPCCSLSSANNTTEAQSPLSTLEASTSQSHPAAHPVRLFTKQHSSSSVANTAETFHVATARAITPMRRPREDSSMFTEEQALPSQRRSDIMAPKSNGIWVVLPYVAATIVLLGFSWIGKKRFVARQERLVAEFGEVMALYGTSPESRRDIARDYKRKIGPGILRTAMFSSYLHSLVTEKAIVPSTIQDVGFVKRLLRLSDDKVVNAVNKLGDTLKEGSPSLLGKLLFLSERVITEPEKAAQISLIPLFPYSAETVSDLQRNMLERCFKEFVSEELDAAEGESLDPPMAAAALLKLDEREAMRLFKSVVTTRQKKKDREAEAEKLVAEAAAAEQVSAVDDVSELDSPARSGEPAKANMHAYQCTECGYTLFPAAGREFKFYGDDFVCPACGSPKDKFIDLNAEE